MSDTDPMAQEPDDEEAGVAEYLARFDAVEDAIDGADVADVVLILTFILGEILSGECPHERPEHRAEVIRLIDDATRQAGIANCDA